MDDRPLSTIAVVSSDACRAADGDAPRSTALARLGDWLGRNRRAIVALQWAIVVFYLLMVALPAFLPHPHPEARVFSSDFGASSALNGGDCGDGSARSSMLIDIAPYIACWQDRLVLAAQYLFWGVWWPFVILSTMVMGRVWCGVLCPEGALAEFASRHGRGGAIPKWLRWSGWPVVAFIATTVYGQLISVYDYAQAALLILGGSTVAALAVGWMYGKGKRVWCRYLCPVSGVFALLARLAPVHFRVEREAWNRYPRRIPAPDCAPLLNVRKLDGMAQCHACGRCSGHRDAVRLAARSPNEEILHGEVPRTGEVALLLFGMIGVAMGAFQWTVSPWFVRGKQVIAEWLVGRDIYWPLAESPAWWLLTRHPEAGDVFTWLDGAAIFLWILGYAAALGGLAWLAVRTAAKSAGIDWRRLALGLVPLAGTGLFLGLSMMTVTHLRAEGAPLGWLPGVRAALLALGMSWSVWLGWRLLAAGPTVAWQRLFAGLLWLLPIITVTAAWWLTFFANPA